MVRRQKVKKVRTQRIRRVRDYGFEKAIREYAKDILLATYEFKAFDEIGRDLYRTFEIKSSKEQLIDMFAALNKKLQIFIKKLPEIFTNIFAMGGTKLMDELGNKLNLAVPDNEAAIKQVIKENVKLVKDITNSQRGGMVEVLKKGVKDGKTYAQVAKDMHETVKDISVERGKLIASTEMNKAMSASMENTLVHNKIEFYLYVTARDNRVSEICNMNSYGQKTQGKTMIKHTVGKGPLPVRNSHPRCRCIIVKAPD